MAHGKLLGILLISVAAAVILLVAVSAEGLWTDTHYSDFMEGIYDAEIYVSRRLQQETSPTDSGCIEYHAKFDVNNDGWYDLISSEESGPSVKIWLGSSSGYSPSNYLAYPVTWAGNCDISDLNLDGYPELIHSGYAMGEACIYWGTATGPSPDDTTLLPNDDGEAVYVADLDKDTYLDIAVAGVWDTLYVYWGSPSGYSTSDRFALPTGPKAHNIEASDLDMNGYLDLIVIQYGQPYDVLILYQTGTRSFTPSSLNFSNQSSPHGLSIGDLNDDGYIDIVATSYDETIHSSIYWGSSSGYSDADKLTLYPGHCYGGSGIADFDKDGLLDILYFRSNSQSPIIYYNSGSPPFFSDTDTEEIGIPLKATGGVVADFDYDGHVDVFVNHKGSYSYVFYGPSFTSYTSLPVSNDHHGAFREPRQVPSYYSRVVRPCSLGMDSLISGGEVYWIADTPGGSKIDIFFRAGNPPIPDSSWTDWYQVLTDTNSGSLPDEVYGHKYIQYRADLLWENAAEMPNLERIEVDITCEGEEGVSPLGLKENVLAELDTLEPQSKRVAKGIKKAKKHIEKSLKPKYWLDETHLVCKKGKKVFHEEKKAVKDLKKLCQGEKCKGVTSLFLIYHGAEEALIEAISKKKTCFGPEMVSPEDTFEINAVDEKLGANTEIWVDGSLDEEIHTSCSKPLEEGMVFGDFEVESVDKIGEGEGGFPSELCERLILMLVKADSILARVAIDDAIAAGGKEKEIEKAEKEMGKAEEDKAKGKYHKAINHYKKAWEHACKAMKSHKHSHNQMIWETKTERRNALLQTSPNPFSKSTMISYSVAVTGRVTLKVYDTSGRLVETLVDEYREPGSHGVQWSPETLASGIYFYRLDTQGFVNIKKMILVR
ncbi:T9SS type A sorting domain-containing protein [candidate division TA06 bacterium]|uniref:T9SS type A sorting domain-containing protein n=1 Tax=candidate division TA06 bacterium TaxID=2250710 RepID=A0A523UY06_UNCT6|nr:MAG: T9SS type A sorting domain-containing protein [candidate division TA06 bacterium]